MRMCSCHAQLHQDGLPKGCWQQAGPAANPLTGSAVCAMLLLRGKQPSHTTHTRVAPACVATNPNMRGCSTHRAFNPSIRPTSTQHSFVSAHIFQPPPITRPPHPHTRAHRQSPTNTRSARPPTPACLVHRWLCKETSSCVLCLNTLHTQTHTTTGGRLHATSQTPPQHRPSKPSTPPGDSLPPWKKHKLCAPTTMHPRHALPCEPHSRCRLLTSSWAAAPGTAAPPPPLLRPPPPSWGRRAA